MFLLKFGSKLQNLVIKLQGAMKILTNYRLHFHEVECTGGDGGGGGRRLLSPPAP